MTTVRVGQIVVDCDGEGTPVVFVHGLGATSTCFQPLTEGLGGFRRIRPDLPGSGRSDLPFGALSIEGFVEAVTEVVRVLGAGPAHFVGHSMGSLVCLHLAARRPELVRSLALFGPIHGPSDEMRKRLKDRATLVRREGMAPVADAVSAGGLSSTTKSSEPLAAAFVRESHLRQTDEGFAQTCEALARAEAADLRFVTVPTLIVTGDEDQVAPPSIAHDLGNRIKAAKVKILDHCGHWTPVERARDCSKLLAGFLAGLRAD